ncbi:MAG: hypothetical protein RDU14_16765 [Melioribacteraceae bacterium]|nr:hypothetical protein [Melioribacteraceae bacterium]
MNEGFTPSFVEQKQFDLAKDFQIGYFIFHEDTKTLAFQDAQQREIDISRILFLTREWDFQNGEKNLPKPYLIDENGAIKEYGSSVLYTYLNSTDARIVMFGPVQDLTLNHVDTMLNPKTTDYEGIQEKHISRNNKKRFFTITEDARGNVFLYLKGKENNGNLGIKIEGKEAANGNFSLSLNGKFALNMQTPDGKTTYTQMLFDNTDGVEKFKIKDKHGNIIEANKTGLILETATIRIGKDQTLKKILDKLIDAITKMTQSTPAGPTVSPPLNMAQFVSIKQELAKFMDTQ